MKILVVEDDRVSRTMLVRNLQNRGHSVSIAVNGLQAWQMLQDDDLRLVVTDWLMPEMDGLTLCQKIREKEKANKYSINYTYIIILTAKGNQDDIIKGLSAGADDYITKPVIPQELHVRIKAGERIVRLHEELNQKNMMLMLLNLKLEEAARTDPLMNIANRRSFYEIALRYHQQAQRHDRPYGVAICDVDYFKNYNDTYGHCAGDRVLKLIGATIKESLRKTDDVFRYGGEELVVLLPEQDILNALQVIEKIRKAIFELGIEHKKSPHQVVTISSGVSVFHKSAETWETVLDWADMALYRAKAAGRNCIRSRTFPYVYHDNKNLALKKERNYSGIAE